MTPDSDGAVISGQLGQDDEVGILVQRIVRHGRGAHASATETVGRVPLGFHHRGGLHIRWNLRVDGQKLGRGTYLITLRALDRNHRVIGASKPARLRIH